MALYDELQDLIDRGITVRHLAVLEPVSCAPSESVEEAKARMIKNGFDLLPLVDAGRIIGYVPVDTARQSTCADARVDIVQDDIIAGDAPLWLLFEIVCARKLPLFVLEHDRIRGLIGRSDLNKAAFRMAAFALITSFEAALRQRLRNYDEDGWTAGVRKASLDRARSIHRSAQRRNEALDLVQCLQLRDLNGATRAIGDQWASDLELNGPVDVDLFFDRLIPLRNRIAHGNDLLADWGSTYETLEAIRRFLKCGSAT